MHKKTLIKIGLSLMAVLLLSQAFMAIVEAQWDFPRLDEILFKIKYPYTVSLEAAKACEIDTYVGAIRTVEVETLKNAPYYWNVTAAPGFHMCYIGINCRDVTPETSGERIDYHGRTPGFPLYPLNRSAFRYALELIVGCQKTVWINDIYGYINVRLDTNVPPASVFWYNPSILPYPMDWDEAYNQLIADGFSGTIGGDDWTMPNGQPLREPIYVMSPDSAPTSMEITRRHVTQWNLFFCGQEVADLPHDCNFVHEPIDFYDEIDIAFYNRDHDMYFLCWGLGRNPDYLWDFFHPDADYPDGNNSPGLSYRPLNAMIDAFKWCMYTEKVDLRIAGPGPMTVAESTKIYTDYSFKTGSEVVWIGDEYAANDKDFRDNVLVRDTDYAYVVTGGKNVGIHLLQDKYIPAGKYLHILYKLENPVAINDVNELQQLCFDIQWILYYQCPYLPIYSRNYHDLFKPGLESWVPSLGYGAAAYQLKWTYGSIHWTGTPVGGSVQWHLPGPVNTFHPYLATSVYEVTILNRLYDGMIEVDAYTHQDIPFLADYYKILDWTGPSGEPGMEIVYYIREDIFWQDGECVSADDFIWQYEFINSIRPSQLLPIWSTYHGCKKYNDFCFSVKTNQTGVWHFYTMTMGLVFPRKVWEPFWGDLAGASAFKPWEVAYTDWVPEGLQGPTPPPTCLYGTGEWIFDSYNPVLALVRVYKNTNSWFKNAAGPCRQRGSIVPPCTCYKNITLEFENTTNVPFPPAGKSIYCTYWHCITPGVLFSSIWHCTYHGDNDNNGLDPCDDINLHCEQPSCYYCLNLCVHVDEVTIVGDKVKITVSASIPKITKRAIRLDKFNADTKDVCVHSWELHFNCTKHASGTQTLDPLQYHEWWQAFSEASTGACLHVITLKINNTNGVNVYHRLMAVLVGDTDCNSMVNMIDLYKVAIVFGRTSGKPGLQDWIVEDMDANGVINMLDLYITAINFGKTCQC